MPSETLPPPFSCQDGKKSGPLPSGVFDRLISDICDFSEKNRISVSEKNRIYVINLR